MPDQTVSRQTAFGDGSKAVTRMSRADIVLDEGNTNLLDVLGDEVVPNRELVNLGHASLNINNSNDVVIGPMTQVHVVGNVNIYQKDNAVNGARTFPNGETDGDAIITTKYEIHEQSIQRLITLLKQKSFRKVLLVIVFGMIILGIGIYFTVINFVTKDNDDIPPGNNNTQLVSREDWNGRQPLNTKKLVLPVTFMVVKHTGGGICQTFTECCRKCRDIQSNAVAEGQSDIIYNFLIGGDGNVYVGRGFDVRPSQSGKILDVAFMGNYIYDDVTSTQIKGLELLLEIAVKKGKLTKDYKLIGHNQTMLTRSPGNFLDTTRGLPNSGLQKPKPNCLTKTKNFFISYLEKKHTKYIIFFILTILACICLTVNLFKTEKNDLLEDENLYQEEYFGDFLGDHKIYYRNDWGADHPNAVDALALPTDLVVISHSASRTCNNSTQCANMVKSFQTYHLSNDFSDIGYNFIIGGDGGIYVGRGWNNENFHTQSCIGINFVGDFNIDEFTDTLAQAALLLTEKGVSLGKLTENYILVGHNQTTSRQPLSPGKNVVSIIKTWKHYSDKILFT